MNIKIMHVKGLLFVILMQLGTVAAAQSEVGVTAGINQSGFYQSTSKKKSSLENFKSGFHIGYTASVFYKEMRSEKIFYGFELENMQVRAGLNYGKVITHMSSYYNHLLLDLNYLNLHVLIGRKVPIKNIALTIEGSPYFGFLLHSKAVGAVSNSMRPEDIINGSANKFIRAANVGLRLKLGVVIPINAKVSLCLNGMGHVGIFSAVKESDFIGIAGYHTTAGVIWKFEKHFLHMDKWKSS